MNPLLILLIAIVTLGGVGALQNNMVASGLGTTMALSCPGWPNVTCSDTVTNGCQLNPSQCTLSGTSISFLNGNSPFTQALQGNIFALFGNLNGVGYQGAGAQSSIGGSHGPFDVSGGGTFYQANVYGKNGTNKDQVSFVILQITQANSDNSNTSEANAVRVNNWNTIQSGVSLTTPFYQWKPNATGYTVGIACNFLAQINYTALANGPGFTYFGCDLFHPTGSSGDITKPTWSVLIAMPVNLGAIPAGNSHQFLFAQPENWDTYDCAGSQAAGGSAKQFNSSPCQNFLNSFKGITVGQSNGNPVQFVPGAGAPLIGFFAGIILFILGLGLQFGFGGGVSAGVNPQGTKLAQIMGLGLIVYTFLFSEFGGWFTPGNVLDVLPNGLDAVVGIIITGCFFFGIYGLTTMGGTGDASSV